MMRNLVLAIGAVAAITAGFIATFGAWRHMDQARAFALGVPYTAFNWKTAHAQERGCNACHADHLAQDVNRLVVGRETPQLHGIFVTSYALPMRVEDCLICHGKSFAGSIHSLHLHAASFTNMGGSCDSCHATTLQGKFVLYDDETRYGILNGVRYDPTPAFAAQSGASEIRTLEQATKTD